MRQIDTMTGTEIETLRVKGMLSDNKGKPAPQSMEHSPLPWLIAEYETFSTIKDRNGKEVGLGQFRKLDAKLIVASVNNAEKLAEALRAWEYAGREGGISMVDWFEVAKKKTRAALADWQKESQ